MDLDVLSTFVAITGASEDKAVEILSATDFHLENAVQLYYATSEDHSRDEGRPSLGGGNMGSGAAAGRAMDVDEDGYRAPIPQKHSVLSAADDDDDYGARRHGRGPAPPPTVMRTAFGAVGGGGVPLVFGGGGLTGAPAGIMAEMEAMHRNFQTDTDRLLRQRMLEDTPGGPRGKELNANEKLANLFQPPHSIMFRGTWQEVRDKAKAEARHIMVNIQDMSEFASQRLNRDTFSVDFIKELISQGFIFWQQYHDGMLGRQFLELYPSVKKFPAILFLNGRTGKLITTLSGFQDPLDFASVITTFLDANPLPIADFNAAFAAGESSASATEDERGAAKRPKSAASSDDTPIEIDDDDDGRSHAAALGKKAAAGSGLDHVAFDEDDGGDEDAELRRAIAASLEEHHSASAAASKAAKAPSAAATVVPAAAPVAAPAPPSPAKRKPVPAAPTLPPEPEATDPAKTSLRVKLPSGATATRRFRKTDPVTAVYAFARLSDPAALDEGKEFILISPGSAAVIEADDRTIEAANLCNSQVMMKYSD